MAKLLRMNSPALRFTGATRPDGADTATDRAGPPSALRIDKLLGYVLIAGAGVLASGCAQQQQGMQRAATGAAAAPAPSLSSTTVLSKLNNPWDMAFLPDGTMFFTEKCNGLSVRQPSGNVVKLLGMKESKGYATTASDLFCEGQAGMNGVAVDPGFATSRFVYVYSASTLTAPGSNRVVRLTVSRMELE